MKEIFVISDTHFGHANIIKYCNRPFADPMEMDEKIIENWNKTVRPEDIIYHLGDVYFGKKNPSNFHRRLNGRKRLILGNHDEGKDPILLEMFGKILMWRMFPDLGVLLTHVPIHPHSFVDHSEERKGKYSVNVHGHIHNQTVKIPKTENDDPRYRCVSVEHINYTPVHIDTLRTK